MLVGTTLAALAAPAFAVPIVQPGAPGAAPRILTPEEASRVANTRFTAADVEFMGAMLHHHRQAVEMAELAPSGTANKPILELANRILASQRDEMKFMTAWLAARGVTPPPMAAGHHHHGAITMAGMASPEQMARLRAAKGREFDRLFLQLMTAHHAGALKMVEELLESPGAAYDPVLYQFTSDVKNEQSAEIKRMDALAATLAADPREGLKPGFRNAGQAISNLTLVAALPKPPGFFDPVNPANLPPPKAKKGVKPTLDPFRDDGQLNDKTEWSDRSPLLSFAQTDMAFAGDRLFVGNYHGFNTYRLGSDGVPVQLGSVVCAGGQGDVSVIGNLLIMSVEQNRGRLDCGAQGVADDVSRERFRGIRIFDISDIARPRQVGLVQTCRGSHTHSIVKGPEGDGRILVYVSGTANVRKREELAGCVPEASGNSSYFRIDVVEIPVANPAAARIVDSPAVFADPRTGELAGLWRGGDHGKDTQETRLTDQCHDITVLPARKLAAGACAGNGIIFDISDPMKPRRIDVVADPGFAYWHSATFNNDGSKVIFTDEWGGGSRPRCRNQDRRDWGANALYDVVDGKLVRRATYKLAAAQSETENCVAHNGSLIPVPGRDIMVQAWYQGGISVFDFTNSAAPTEIGYFDRGPIDAKRDVLGGHWSAYYYRGRIYATEIARGLDVLALKPSAMLSANEIAAAALADVGPSFNPQQQYPVRWPAVTVVARAYADQLRRAGTLDPAFGARLEAALADTDARLAQSARDASLAARLTALAAETRHAGLAETLRQIAARIN
ncbi:DUF305 domain-containing protein [Sphingomonas mesophila]|uniref:DUF305 domain-containing protein n=1 Tax=Sphingomonas mesophila TaxID=2303576 RepID=UPI00308421F8